MGRDSKFHHYFEHRQEVGFISQAIMHVNGRIKNSDESTESVGIFACHKNLSLHSAKSLFLFLNSNIIIAKPHYR